MNKERMKGILTGFILCAILSTSVLVLANTVTREITYGVRVNLNGQLMQFDDESQPFVMDGRTFLPVRAIADALGLDVSFDADTNTAYLSGGAVATIPSAVAPITPVPMPEPIPEATPEPTPEPTPEQEPTTPEQQTGQSIVGIWNWMGIPYYVFNENGQGTMSGMDINWSTSQGILTVCTTPELCGSTCIAPSEWYYVISGDEMVLTSRLIPGMVYTYTRR